MIGVSPLLKTNKFYVGQELNSIGLQLNGTLWYNGLKYEKNLFRYNKNVTEIEMIVDTDKSK